MILRCKSCNKPYDTKDLSYKEGFGVVCKECKIKSQSEKIAKISKLEKEDIYKNDSKEKINHKCSKCGYKFVYNVAKSYPDKCPYCNTSIRK